MNEKNIRDSVSVLKRVRDRGDKLSLRLWHEITKKRGAYAKSEEELIAACIGGWIAVSPEFRAAGGGVANLGVPAFGGLWGFGALALYWGVDEKEVKLRCDKDETTARYYGVDSVNDVTIDMAIQAVESLLDLT